MPLTSALGGGRYSHSMQPFAILNSRKRAIIALVHTFAFLGLAVRDFVASSRLMGVLTNGAGHARSLVFLIVYLIVTMILAYLLRLSKGSYEQVYFALCTASAGTGVLRAVVGDLSFPTGQYFRMGFLTCAALAGYLILRLHADQPEPALD